MFTWYSGSQKKGYKKHRSSLKKVPNSHKLGKQTLHYPRSDYKGIF